jgi:hypothetical protein
MYASRGTLPIMAGAEGTPEAGAASNMGASVYARAARQFPEGKPMSDSVGWIDLGVLRDA